LALKGAHYALLKNFREFVPTINGRGHHPRLCTTSGGLCILYEDVNDIYRPSHPSPNPSPDEASSAATTSPILSRDLICTGAVSAWG
jgi:hypothetical protein